MPILAERIDAVVGVDTHRDTHEVEIAHPTGRPSRPARSTTTPTATPNCWPGSSTTPPDRGSRCPSRAPAATASDWPARHRRRADRHRVRTTGPQDPPRPRQIRPDRRPPRRAGRAPPGHQPTAHSARRRRPRSPAHPAGRPPRADHHQHRQTNRLRALLLSRRRHRPRPRPRKLSDSHADPLARRRLPRDAARAQAVRHAEIRRLALAVLEARRALAKPTAPNCSPSLTNWPPA